MKIVVAIAALFALGAALVAVDRTFGVAARDGSAATRLVLPPARGEIGLPPVLGPPDPGRPLLVIDPGHGGHDPGAGQGDTREKDLTLALGRALRDELLRQGGVRVALTRDDDRYLLLPERAGIARRLGADLFVSIHADSGGSETASGATIYTLSEKGSSQIAARMAERENRADMIDGVMLADQSDRVSAILVDLSQRETQARSDQFAGLLRREAQGSIKLRDEPLQSAAFVVLKSADIPSVLLEAGYISNTGDSAWMLSGEGRQTFAAAGAKAVRAYFARQSR
jgi:N-acetylmuramoyl-L-alanine amidase